MLNVIRRICSAPAPSSQKPRKRARLGFEYLERRELRTPGLATSLLGGICAMSPATALPGLGAIVDIADTVQGSAAPAIQAVEAPVQVASGHVAPVDIASIAEAVLIHVATCDGAALQVDLASAAEAVVTQLPTCVQTGIATCLFVAMVDSYG